MRIHGNQMNLNSVNPYAAAAEKAIAAQRAANVRKKRIGRAASTDRPATPDKYLLIDGWTSFNRNSLQSPGQEWASISGRDLDFR